MCGHKQILLQYGPYSMVGKLSWPALTLPVNVLRGNVDLHTHTPTHREHRKPQAPGEALLTPSDTLLSFKPAEELQILSCPGCQGAA